MTIEDFVQKEYREYLEQTVDVQLTPNPSPLGLPKDEQTNETFVPRQLFTGNRQIIVHFHGFPPISQYRRELVEFHKHQCFEMVYVYRGTFHNEFKTNEILLHEGDFLLLNPYIMHSVYTETKHDLVFDFLVSTDFMISVCSLLRDFPSSLSVFLRNSLYGADKKGGYLYFPANQLQSASIRQTADCMIQEAIEQQVGSDAMIQSLTNVLMTQLARSHPAENDSTFTPSEYAGKRKSSDRVFFEMIEYMRAHAGTTTLDDLVEKFHYSGSYISRQLKKLTGRSFQEILHSLRLSNAAEQLRNTDLPIAEISVNAGFSDISYFYRVFKKKYGVSPLKYRKGGSPSVRSSVRNTFDTTQNRDTADPDIHSGLNYWQEKLSQLKKQ